MTTEIKQKIKVSFDIYKGKKGSILLKFPQVIKNGLSYNNTYRNGYSLWSEYNIVSRDKKNKVVFGMSVDCSNLMKPETYDYIAITEGGIILDTFTKDYRNYFDKSVKEWKNEVIKKLKEVLKK